MKEVIEELKREGLYYDGSAKGEGQEKEGKKDKKKKKVESDDE